MLQGITGKSSLRRHSNLIAASLLALSTWGQVPTNSVEIDAPILSFFFLTLQAQDAQSRSPKTPGTPDDAERAATLGVRVGEISAIDAAARSFVAREKDLAAEARLYASNHQEVKEDPAVRAVYESFTARREALAADAFGEIKRRISVQSYEALLKYLNTTIRSGIKIAKIER